MKGRWRGGMYPFCDIIQAGGQNWRRVRSNESRKLRTGRVDVLEERFAYVNGG